MDSPNMEAIQRLITETKRLAMEEDDLKSELSQLKSELFVEEQNLHSLEKGHEVLKHQAINLQQALDYSNRHVELIKSFSETFRSSYMLHAFLKEFIDRANPNSEDQSKKLNSLQELYTKLLEKYEQIPTYVSIIQEETNEKELAALITEKRNELMKLETQQEY